MQQLQPLRRQLGVEETDTCHIAARPVEAGDKAELRPGLRRLRTRSGSSWSPPWPPAPTAMFDGGDHGDLPANQIGRQCRQPIELIFRPAVFDRDVLALDIAGLFEALAESRDSGSRDCAQAIWLLRNPITGIAGCCARAASGHAAAAPPSSVMNSRRCSGRDVRFIARPPPRSVRAAFPHTAPASGV